MEQQIRFCTTADGVRIAYATVGQGPPLVWVPGWISHLELSWENPAVRQGFELLAEHFLLIRYDKRGSGLSDRGVTDFSLEARLRDLEAVVQSLKLRRFSLYAISEGGPPAIAYAARQPRRVNRLALYGALARGSAWPKETIDALAALVRVQWGLGSETMNNLFAPGASLEEREVFAHLQLQAATAADAAAMIQANAEIDVSHLLGQVRAPTLVVHARGDRVVPFEQGREIAGAIPNARLVPIESDRHAPGPEALLQVLKTVLDFLLEEQPEARGSAGGSGREASGTVTIMFTDMEGSTSLTQRLGDAKAQELLRAHNTIVRDALKAHAGSEIKHTGDGIMASFPSASGALECAIAIQRAFDARNAGVGAQLGDGGSAGGAAPGGGVATDPIRVRIGLNAGEPVAEDADLFGTAVQLAARVCAQAQPAQILVPEGVRHLVAGKGFLFSDQGDIALRGFEDPVRLYEVSWKD